MTDQVVHVIGHLSELEEGLYRRSYLTFRWVTDFLVTCKDYSILTHSNTDISSYQALAICVFLVKRPSHSLWNCKLRPCTLCATAIHSQFTIYLIWNFLNSKGSSAVICALVPFSSLYLSHILLHDGFVNLACFIYLRLKQEVLYRKYSTNMIYDSICSIEKISCFVSIQALSTSIMSNITTGRYADHNLGLCNPFGLNVGNAGIWCKYLVYLKAQLKNHKCRYDSPSFAPLSVWNRLWLVIVSVCCEPSSSMYLL